MLKDYIVKSLMIYEINERINRSSKAKSENNNQYEENFTKELYDTNDKPKTKSKRYNMKKKNID